MIDALVKQITERFNVTPAQARKMILEQDARSRRKAAIVASDRRLVLAAEEVDWDEDPSAWRQEVQRRMQALEIMDQGVKDLKDLQKVLKRIIESESKLIGTKTSKVNNKDDGWWDMQHSGWAMGGRERFAQSLCDIFKGLDEAKLASYILDKVGFKRSIPIDEDDVPPLVPADLVPGQSMPGEDPPDAGKGVEAALVRAASQRARRV